MQAMFDAEALATNALQLRLLDAVLADDHRQVSRLLDEEDHSTLLEDRFFLCLSVILMGKADTEVIRAFSAHSYDAGTVPLRSSGILKMGDIALLICAADRQEELVEAGFLNVKHHAYAGMGNVNPEVFDLWCRLYNAAAPPHVDNVSPSASRAIFRWLAESHRKDATQRSQSSRKEMSRRLDKMVSGFLDSHYPAENSQDRWNKFVSNPPSVSIHAGSVQESAIYMKVLVDHMFREDLRLHHNQDPIHISLSVQHTSGPKSLLAHALLRAGVPSSAFEPDLATECLLACSAALRRNENPSGPVDHLWGEVARRLQKEDPERFSALPAEVKSPAPSIRIMARLQDPSERLAFCDMLEMLVSSPLAPQQRPRPRL